MLKTIRALLFTTVLSCSAIALAAVNVNTANVAELQQLKGIGAKKAADIVAYREANGDFKTVDELTNVKGIGKATLEKLRTEIAVEDDKAAGAAKSTSVVADVKISGAEQKTEEGGKASIPDNVRNSKAKADKASEDKVVDEVKKSETRVKSVKTKNNAGKDAKEN